MKVLLASAGIILVAIVFWFRWNPRVIETARDLAAIRHFFEKAEPTGKFAIQEANRKTSNPNIKGILAESFVRTFKRNYDDLAHRPDAQTVLRQLAGWFERYNTQHPRSALGYLPPRRFRQKQAVNC
jgi:putative transposase